MTIGNSVYPMMQTLCANELCHQRQSTTSRNPAHVARGEVQGDKEKEISHVPAQKLDLERNDRLPDPHHGKHPAEHLVPLVDPGVEAEQHAEQQAEDERAPEVPVAQPGGHVVLQQGLGVHDAAREARELLAGARYARAPQVGVRAAQALGRLEHGPAQQVPRPQHLAHLAPHREEVPPQRVPHALVDGALRRAPVLPAYPRRQVVLAQATPLLLLLLRRR